MVRIGHLSPTKTQEEMLRAFYQLVPNGFKLAHRTLDIKDLVDEEINQGMARAGQEALELAAFGVDIIVLGGTPTVLTSGQGFVQEFRETVAAKAGIPVGFSHFYQREALRHLKIKRPVVVTPWGDRVGRGQNELLARDLQDQGISPAAFFGLDISLADRGRLPDDYLEQRIAELLPKVKEAYDSFYIPCANWPVVPAIPPLERRYGVPVAASTPALVWGVARDLSLGLNLTGRGRLLEQGGLS